MCFVKLCFKKKLMGICAWRDVWRINKKDKPNIWLHMPDENVILKNNRGCLLILGKLLEKTDFRHIEKKSLKEKDTGRDR